MVGGASTLLCLMAEPIPSECDESTQIPDPKPKEMGHKNT